VPRGFVTVLTSSKTPKVDAKQSGRLELAQWLTSSDNPLTARVMANRVWYHLFGAGLVETVDNFGVLGEQPSHPQLLDTLAVDFMKGGWSVKKLVRSIVLSHSYQMSSDHDVANYAADPENRLVCASIVAAWTPSRSATRSCRPAVSWIWLDHKAPPMPNSAWANWDAGLRSRLPISIVTAVASTCPWRADTFLKCSTIFDAADPSLVVGQREVTTRSDPGTVHDEQSVRHASRRLDSAACAG